MGTFNAKGHTSSKEIFFSFFYSPKYRWGMKLLCHMFGKKTIGFLATTMIINNNKKIMNNNAKKEEKRSIIIVVGHRRRHK